MTYTQTIEKSMSEKLTSLTGITSAAVKKHGIRKLLERPELLNEKQKEKVNLLKSFITDYNEVVFLQEQEVIDSSTGAQEYFLNKMKYKIDKEVFWMVCLDSQNKVIWSEVVSEGTINESPVYVREIVKIALYNNAVAVIVSHNHPGGSLRPSLADIDVTENIKKALDTVQIKLMDHIIIAGPTSTYSFAEKGVMPR